MTIKQNILAVLRGQTPTRVPWNIHGALLHPGSLEREWRNAGLGIVDKSTSAYQSVMPNVAIEERQVWEEGRKAFQITYRTAVGDLHSKKVTGPDGSLWVKDYPVQSADDLRVLEFIVRDTVYFPNHAGLAQAQKNLGEDGVVVSRLLRSPLQRLLVEWMGTEGVAYALADFPEKLDHLLQCMAAADEAPLQITAQSTADIVWSAENITSAITSPKLFMRYCLPYYNHFAAVLHSAHKLYGIHLDGRLAALKDAIAKTDLDFVEAFTPPPMGDLALAEARAAWPGKVIWANFPGCVFHSDDEAVVRYTLELLQAGLTGGRFMLTFSEDIPDPERSLRLIAQAVARYEREYAVSSLKK